VVAINYLVSLPKASRLWDNGFVRNALDGWQVAGITRFNSGGPLYLSTDGTKNGNSDTFFGSGQLQFPSGYNTDLTGGGDGWRPQFIGNPVLPRGDRSYFHYFNPYAYTLPGVVTCNTNPAVMCRLPAGVIGTAPAAVASGPGIANFNMSLFKNFDVTERVKLQFRAEAYNVFNHTQFEKVNTSPKFNPDGSLANALVLGADGNPAVSDWFGRVTSARDPRIMQFALRITF